MGGAFLCCAWSAHTGGRTVIFHPKRRQENHPDPLWRRAMASGQGSIATCFRASLSRLSDPPPLIELHYATKGVGWTGLQAIFGVLFTQFRRFSCRFLVCNAAFSSASESGSPWSAMSTDSLDMAAERYS